MDEFHRDAAQTGQEQVRAQQHQHEGAVRALAGRLKDPLRLADHLLRLEARIRELEQQLGK